jgi:O-antigen ligase
VAIFWGSAVARSRFLIIAGVVGFVGGGYGALLSGTRAAWLSALILVPLILLVAIYFRFYKTASALFFSTVMLVFISAGISEFGVHQRIESSVNEVASYFDGDVRGSAGLRLELWRSAQMLFSERPFIGYGQTAYQERITTLAEEGVVNHQVSGFNHLHNDWMNALAKGGILGFLVLLGVYLAPITLATPNVIKPRYIPSGLLAVACLVIVGNFLMYGLMHNAFGANNGVMTYVFWMVLFVSGATSAFRERADAF